MEGNLDGHEAMKAVETPETEAGAGVICRETPRVAFITSHPIQYQVPVFRDLAARTDMQFVVLYAMLPNAAAQGAGFGVTFEWDIPLLEGYHYHLLKNVSANPGVTHFSGCDTPGLESVLRELRIDVVVVNGWVVKTCLQALRAARRLRIPCVVRGEANHLRRRPWWKRLLQRILVRKYDAYLPIGSANKAFYRSYGVSESQMFPAPYCIENARFERAASEALPRRNALREQWGIPTDAVCFLFCGKFEHKKHPLELVEAFLRAQKSLSQAGTDKPIHLLMVGDGELRGECEKLVVSFQKSSSRTSDDLSLVARPSPLAPITFAGFLNQSRIVDAYVACDTLVLPSDSGETWGLVVNESMACGRPAIVSSQVGCAEDLITHGQTGWVFPFGDWDALSMLFCEILKCDAQLPSMQMNCRSRISDYSPQIAAEGIVMAVNAVHQPHGNST